jgi:hypothetical protein
LTLNVGGDALNSILEGRKFGKLSLGRPRRRREDNIEGTMWWLGLDQDRLQWLMLI